MVPPLLPRLRRRRSDPLHPRREALERAGIRGDRVRNEPGIQLPRRHIDILHAVAQLVVAGIEPLAGLAAKHVRLLTGLDALGARRDAAAGDAVADERVVVAAAVERDECEVLAVRGVEVLVQLAQLRAARGVRLVGRVVDLVREVGDAIMS